MVFWSNFRRLVYIVTVIAKHSVAQLENALVTRWPKLAFSHKLVRCSGPQRLRLFFEDLGGTFIKFGQMLALQPDILVLLLACFQQPDGLLFQKDGRLRDSPKRPRAAEVLVDGATHQLVRRRETYADLVRPELEI